MFLKRAVNTTRGGDGAAKDTATRTSSRGRHSLVTVASLVPLGEASSKIDESSVHCQSRPARLSATGNIGLLFFERVRPRVRCLLFLGRQRYIPFGNSRYRQLGRPFEKITIKQVSLEKPFERVSISIVDQRFGLSVDTAVINSSNFILFDTLRRKARIRYERDSRLIAK